MPFTPLTFEELRDGLVDDWRNRVEGADTSEDSLTWQVLSVIAGGLWGLHYRLGWVEDQVFPDTADSANLQRHAAVYGLEKKAAQAASDGTVRVTVDIGTEIEAGLSLTFEDGTTYTTTSGGTSVGGYVDVTAAADEAGLGGNRDAGDALVVEDAPAGVDDAEVLVAFTDGVDEETDAQLLERLLARIRTGAPAGTAADYEAWALTVTGVAFAYCLPTRRGAGSVSVVVCAADVDGNRVDAGATIRAEVAAYINTVRPICADVDVPELTFVDVDVEVTLTELDDGLVVADVEDMVSAAIEEVIYAVEPSVERGSRLYLKALIRAIAKVEGVLDFDLDSPTANLDSTVDLDTVSILRPGTITINDGTGA